MFYSVYRAHWRSSSELPGSYRNFDLYKAHKVVVNDPDPYRHDRRYREQYASFRGQHDQESIRDSRDSKYFGNPGNPEHGNWERQHGADNHSDNDRNRIDDRGGK
jgi:hypothetical protein